MTWHDLGNLIGSVFVLVTVAWCAYRYGYEVGLDRRRFIEAAFGTYREQRERTRQSHQHAVWDADAVRSERLRDRGATRSS